MEKKRQRLWCRSTISYAHEGEENWYGINVCNQPEIKIKPKIVVLIEDITRCLLSWTEVKSLHKVNVKIKGSEMVTVLNWEWYTGDDDDGMAWL